MLGVIEHSAPPPAGTVANGWAYMVLTAGRICPRGSLGNLFIVTNGRIFWGEGIQTSNDHNFQSNSENLSWLLLGPYIDIHMSFLYMDKDGTSIYIYI